MSIEQYVHHGHYVYVMSELKGKHREHCLCSQCAAFKPNTLDNCKIAQSLFEICVRENLVTPVYECPCYDNTNERRRS